jgi:hypothetical protein
MRSNRRQLLVVFVALVVALLCTHGIATAGAQPSDRDRYLANTNALRASLGLGPLQLDPELTALAQNWAEHLAAIEDLEHPPDIRAGVTSPWQELGDNTGRGSTFELAWDALVRSPIHYENLTRPTFTHVGIGVATSASGVQYVHQWFMTIQPVVEAPPERPPRVELPPPAPVEPPPEVVEVLPAVELPPVNLAVIPLVRYGQAAGVFAPAPPPPSSAGLPPWLFAAVGAALLLAIAGLGLWQYQRRRSPA